MRYLFFLSGEHPELAEEEVFGLLGSYGKVEGVGRDQQILVADYVGDRGAFNRLALTHEISEHIATCDFEDLWEVFRNLPVPSGKVCVRVRKIGKGWESLNSLELERNLGAELWKRGAEISVSSPDRVIRVYLSTKAHVGILIHRTDKKQFLERRPDRRPFFMPSVIVPRFARALVNVTGVRGNMLDPMCGTGTFLIEAGLMGVEFAGVDAFRKVVWGCAKNLRHFGLPVNVVWGDARNLPFKDESFDAVVTDFPYQRSTRKFGEDLYERATEEIFRVLKEGRRAVLVFNFDAEEMLKGRFEVEGKFLQRVHKSLVRRFYVCRKR